MSTSQQPDVADLAPANGRSGEDDRRLWEAKEEIEELRGRLAAQLERERILEIEVAALRKDLEVKIAYSDAQVDANETLERHLGWLQEHYDIEAERARCLSEELAAERARIYYRLLNPVLHAIRGAKSG